jgi:hypothetical protein
VLKNGTICAAWVEAFAPLGGSDASALAEVMLPLWPNGRPRGFGAVEGISVASVGW